MATFCHVHPAHPDPRDVDTATRILGQAFCDYPVFTATLTDPLRRQAALPLTFRSP